MSLRPMGTTKWQLKLPHELATSDAGEAEDSANQQKQTGRLRSGGAVVRHIIDAPGVIAEVADGDVCERVADVGEAIVLGTTAGVDWRAESLAISAVVSPGQRTGEGSLEAGKPETEILGGVSKRECRRTGGKSQPLRATRSGVKSVEITKGGRA